MGGPVRGRGPAGRLAARRGGRTRGVFPGRGAARGGLVRGEFGGPRLSRCFLSAEPQRSVFSPQAVAECVAVAGLLCEGGAVDGAAADRP